MLPWRSTWPFSYAAKGGPMSHRGLYKGEYPGFDKGLVERSWPYIGSYGTVRLYDSEDVRPHALEQFPTLDWESQILPAISAGVEKALADWGKSREGLTLPLLIRCRALGCKVPLDLRYAIDAPEEQIGAVMRLLPIESLPLRICFGNPAYLEAQSNKAYAEAIEALREISRTKRRFFTCNEIDHHLFTHIFDNGNYRTSFQIVEV